MSPTITAPAIGITMVTAPSRVPAGETSAVDQRWK